MSDDPIRDRILAYLGNEELIQKESYLKGGRIYAKYNLAELSELWIKEFQVFCHELNRDAKKVSEDIQAEFSMRNHPIPWDEVKPAMAALQAQVKAKHDSLTSEATTEIGKGIVEDLERFEEEFQRPPN